MSEESKQYIPTSTTFQPRYTGPSPENMSPEQTALRKSILESRPRTGLSGPFGPWLAVPAIAVSEKTRATSYPFSVANARHRVS